LGVVDWAAANTAANKTVATARSFLAMAIAYDQIPGSWHLPGSGIYVGTMSESHCY
jgi:hypothetical protein